MAYDRFKTIPGIPGDENTAVTMRAIQDILDEEGVGHLLMKREPAKDSKSAAQAKPAPLRALAEEAQQKTGLQTPPHVQTKRNGKSNLPELSSADDDATLPPQDLPKTGLLPKLFGRK